MIQFDLPKQKSSIIKVLGVGGGGSNAVNFMFEQNIEGVDFIICNTDAKAIEQSNIPNKIQLGPHLTQGLGAGANPEVGKKATEESLEEIKRILEVNTKMAFITVGMGGGTGTGGAPIIAQICKELGILTVGIVTTPFAFEGPRRHQQAEEGIAALKPYVDTLLQISNDKLRIQYGNLKMKEAFGKADNVLATAAKCITDIINSRGHIIVDFADVCTVMKNGGVAILGKAEVEGEDRAQKAIEEALSSPLLNDNDIKGAKWILININSAEGEHECTMDEMETINGYLRLQAGEDTDVIVGMGYDPSLDKKIGITLIATGFEHKDDYAKNSSNKQVAPVEEKIISTLILDLDNPSAMPPIAENKVVPIAELSPEPTPATISAPSQALVSEPMEMANTANIAACTKAAEPMAAPAQELLLTEAPSSMVWEFELNSTEATADFEADVSNADLSNASNLAATIADSSNEQMADLEMLADFDAEEKSTVQEGLDEEIVAPIVLTLNDDIFAPYVPEMNTATEAAAQMDAATVAAAQGETAQMETAVSAAIQTAATQIESTPVRAIQAEELLAHSFLQRPTRIYEEEASPAEMQAASVEPVISFEPFATLDETVEATASIEDNVSAVAELATEDAAAEITLTNFASPVEAPIQEEEAAIQLVMKEPNTIHVQTPITPVSAAVNEVSAAMNQFSQVEMTDEVEEHKKRAAERIQKLRNLSFNMSNTPDGNCEFDQVPAYVRRNMELFGNTLTSVENFYSKYTVGKDENNQGPISSLNSFLDGKKPD